MSTLAIAASGLRSARTKVAAASHNVANLNTPRFRPLEVTQRPGPGGGSEARVRQAAEPRPVDLAQEHVNQTAAGVQFHASLGVIETESEMMESLLDLYV